MRASCTSVVFIAICASVLPLAAMGDGVTYSFIGESRLIDSCPVCGRPDFLVPIEGSFQLRFVEQTPIEVRYAVENLAFKAADGSYQGSGAGRFIIASVGPAELQRWNLELDISHSGLVTHALVKESSSGFERAFPMIKASLEQTNGTATLQYFLSIEAAPLADFWFATSSGFTPGEGADYVRGGTVLSQSGRVVRTTPQLLEAFQLEPLDPAPQLDALDVRPGGLTVFSLNKDVASKAQGTLHHGDVLASDGTVYRRFGQLLSGFIFQPPTPDLGLDALHVSEDGVVLFSVDKDAFSERLGILIRHGSLLTEKGEVLRTNASLLERFHPPAGDHDYGLDALSVWPHGEIWFSLEEGFQDDLLGHVGPGDLLSDQGYVVYRNLDLMRPFSPLEDLADFGLDALFVITERGVPSPPQFTLLQADPAEGSLRLAWQGGGRVFQIERTLSLAVPFAALGPIDTNLSFIDQGILTQQPRAFYRVRQW